MRTGPRGVAVLLGLGGLGILLSVSYGSSREQTSPVEVSSPPVVPAAASPRAKESGKKAPLREAKALLRDATSAYSSRVFSRESEVIVLTPTHFFRIGVGDKVEKHQANLGHLFTLLEDSIVFFKKGGLHALSLSDLSEREVIRPEKRPQVLLAEGPRLAWMVGEEGGPGSLQTLSAGAVLSLYTGAERLSVPLLHDGVVYFVEESGQAWKLGRVSLDGGPVDFGEVRTTRPPSMLAAGPDGLYFYDGLGRGVRKVSFELRFEESINEDVICAPLAVKSRVVCAQVGGIIDIPWPGADARLVAREVGGPIADMTVSDTQAFWIADGGENRMFVRSADLPEL